MALDKRKKYILRALVNDFIRTGEPVGSRTIAKKYDLGISSATIRNEMSDLEDLGYLEQPHTSAGRVPSDLGYRLYVDELMEVEYPTKEEIEAIKGYLQFKTIHEMDRIIRRTTKLLSDVTNYTSMVLSPSVKKSSVKSIQIIKISQMELLAVVVTDTCIIKNAMVKTKKPISLEKLNEINNMLICKLSGRTVENIDRDTIAVIQRELIGYEEILDAILVVLHDSLLSKDCEIYLEGASNIFQYPEYSDVGRAKNFLSIIEKRDMLANLFSDNERDLSVTIGKENLLNEIKELSIVKTSYNTGGNALGYIGIIGPTRMNYSKVMGILRFLSSMLNEAFDNSKE